MPAGIFVAGPNGGLSKMKPTDYLSEAELQDLLEQHPELLDGCASDGRELQLLLIKREMPVQDHDGNQRWSMDHFFICSDCVPTLVEVKRSANPQVRREVVGQMLDYAANGAAYWPIESIQERFEQQWGSQAAERLDEFLPATRKSAEEFWQAVESNLRATKLRLIFVADALPPELKTIIGFLSDHLRSNVSVYGVEVGNFINGQQRAYVRTVIGRTDLGQVAEAANYENLTQAQTEFERLTNSQHRIYGGTRHFRQIRLVPNNDGIHYELTWTKGKGVTCEFHVEGSQRHPLLRSEMEAIASEHPTIAGGQVQFYDRRENGGLWIQPESQEPATVARTLIELMNMSRTRLMNALAAETR